jgi:protein TonB
VLHGALLLLILPGGPRVPVSAAGMGDGVLSVFEVGLVSLPGGPGRNAAAQTLEASAELLPEQGQEPEPAAAPEEALALPVERPKKRVQQATRTRRPEQAPRPQHSAPVPATQGEDGEKRDSAGDKAALHSGEGGSGALAAPGAAAGDPEPFGFPFGAVNGKPKVVKSVRVVYPEEARKKGINGQVLVRFHLDEHGTISHLHVKSAQPPDIFNLNTLAAIRKWRFQPGVHDGKTVPVWVELPVEFELR